MIVLVSLEKNLSGGARALGVLVRELDHEDLTVSPHRKQPGQAGPEVEPVGSPVLFTLSGVNDKVGGILKLSRVVDQHSNSVSSVSLTWNQ